MGANTDFLIINNVRMPIPAPGMTIDSGQGVDAGRNANNQIVGQLVGDRLWKINNLSWRGLSEAQVKMIMDAIEPFYVKVTFRIPSGEVITKTMYPSDTSGKPLAIQNMTYTMFEDFHFNLIDTGWD